MNDETIINERKCDPYNLCRARYGWISIYVGIYECIKQLLQNSKRVQARYQTQQHHLQNCKCCLKSCIKRSKVYILNGCEPVCTVNVNQSMNRYYRRAAGTVQFLTLRIYYRAVGKLFQLLLLNINTCSILCG